MSRFEVYQDAKGEWRWRLKARNGRIVADSGEGYVDQRGALRSIAAVLRAAAKAKVVVS